MYKVCEVNFGYCSVFKIYVVEDKVCPEFLARESVVLDLLQTYFKLGYTVFLDNWYVSLLIFVELLKQNVYAIGTALKTRIDIPDVFKTIHLEKMKLFLDLQTVFWLLCGRTTKMLLYCHFTILIWHLKRRVTGKGNED